jgi:hypothetical protein
MKTPLIIAFAVLLSLGVTEARASLAVDPMAAALGSSSVFEPIQDEAGVDPLAPTTRDTPMSWQGIHTSSIYLVRRDDRSGVWFSEPGVSETLQPIDPGAGTVDIGNLGGGELSDTSPRLHDPSRQEWLGLDLRQGLQPILVIPRGSVQRDTPTTPAPEPGTVMLLASGLGALGAAGFARRRQARQA